MSLPRLMPYALLAGLLVVPACTRAPADRAADSVHEVPAEGAEGAAQPGAARVASPGSDAPEGKVFGEGVTGATPVTIAQLLADPGAYAGKAVQVEGMVTDVCPKRGCWFDMAGQEPGDQRPGMKMRFKVQDGVMVFPMDAKGKHAVAEGVVSVQTLTLEETRKHLEYQAREYGQDVDPASVTEPMTIVRLDGTGAVLRDRK